MFGEPEKTTIYIGSDHAGYEMKQKVKPYLEEKGYKVTDLGAFSEDSVDYPEVAREVGEKVLESEGSPGILICGTGIGMSMAANRLKGIRAALLKNVEDAEMTRKHNNANVACFGGRTTSEDLIKKMLDKFLSTKFEEDAERHVRRVKEMDEFKDS